MTTERVPILVDSENTDDASIISEKLVVPNTVPQSSKDIDGKTIAVGGGIGAAVVVLANVFIHDQIVRTSIQGLAPTLTLIVTPIFGWVGNEIGGLYQEYKTENRRKKLLSRAKEALERMRVEFKEINDDSAASKSHKEKLRNTMERMELTVLKLNVKGILVIDD